MCFVKKRGQVTIFAIVGVALLLVTLIVVLYQRDAIRIDDAVVVPPELLPARTYIDYCLDQASITAFTLLGNQGGFIEVPPQVRAHPGRRIMFAEGLEYIPYWYYEANNHVPSFELMEKQLEEYINTNFEECIDEVIDGNARITIRKLQNDARTEVRINERDVVVEVILPLEISSADRTIQTRLSRFSETYNLPLKHIMELGEYILDYANEYEFFEGITIDMMALHPNVPFSGMELSCGGSVWPIEEVKRDIQFMLSSTFSEIRIEGTDYFPYLADESLYEEYQNYAQEILTAISQISLTENFEEIDGYERALETARNRVGRPGEPVPPDAFFYNKFRMPMLDTNPGRYTNFAVDVTYMPDYNMDIQGKPSQGGVLRSNTMRGAQRFLSFMCINLYHFVYDITYPVVIHISYPDALNNRGYTFRYALPVIIRNNEGMREREQMDFYPGNVQRDDFCHEAPGRNVFYRAYDASHSLDAPPLEDVTISLVCVLSKCEVGTTQRDGIDAFLRGVIPDSCSNPFVMAEREGYRTAILSEGFETDLVNIEMVRLDSFEVEFNRHPFNVATNTTNPPQPVTEGTIILYIGGFAQDSLYEETYIFDMSDPSPKYIELPVISAGYEVSLTYLRNNEDYSGGYTGLWSPSTVELVNGDTVTFDFVEVFISALEEEAIHAFGVIETISQGFTPSIR